MRHTYILECADGSLYTGITTDLERRLFEHNNDPKWAKYTKTKRPVQLVWSTTYDSRSEASKKEWRIKQMSKNEKLTIIAQTII